MPDTTGLGAYPIPLMSENPNASIAFGDFRASIAPHTVLFATSEANRNSLYGSGATSESTVPSGTIVSSSTTKAVWQKSPTGWNVIYSDTGFVSLSGASWSADFSDNGSVYRVQNGLCTIEFRGTYEGADLPANANGNVTNTPMLTVPSAIRPIRSGAHITMDLEVGSWGGSAILFQSSSNLSLAMVAPDVTVTAGTNVMGVATYYVA